MSPEQIEIIFIAIIVAAACAIPGVFLVLRRVALMSDAISHAILLGIVAMFFLVKDFHSPWLIVGATLTGILTVTLTEMIIRSNRLKKDAAIGLVFPALFSIGVILINLKASDIHLDEDAVLLGELAFAPFNRWEWMGVDMGPIALWTMSAILIVNIVFVLTCYKELKIATFDKGLAQTLGFLPGLIHYLLMTTVSITAVGAFDAVGSILVVALMITPPATAYLLTQRLSTMIILSVVQGALSAIMGYALAHALDASIAGSMATMSGILFVLALLLSPQQGLLMKMALRKEQRTTFAVKMLLVQLLDHEGSQDEAKENTFDNMIDHMDWSEKFATSVTSYAISKGFITRNKAQLNLTDLGRESAKEAMRLT